MGLVGYPKQLAVEHAGGDDRHHDAASPLGHPFPLLRVAEEATHALALSPQRLALPSPVSGEICELPSA